MGQEAAFGADKAPPSAAAPRKMTKKMPLKLPQINKPGPQPLIQISEFTSF